MKVLLLGVGMQGKVEGLAEEAKARKVTILPEFGMDPGIDLVLLGEAVRSLDDVEEIISRRVNYDRSHL